MQNMKKLKEDALRRKREFEEKQRNQELQQQRRTSGGRPRPDRHRSAATRNQKAADSRHKAQAPAAHHKKPRKTPARWVLDILLILGTLMVLVMLFNPY